MALLLEMSVLYAVLSSIETVNVTYKGKFILGCFLRPVLSVGNYQLGPGSGQGGNFGIVGLVLRAPVDGHAALAYATTEEMRGNLANGNGDGHPLIQGRQDKGLRPPPEQPVIPIRFGSTLGRLRRKSRTRMLFQVWSRRISGVFR